MGSRHNGYRQRGAGTGRGTVAAGRAGAWLRAAGERSGLSLPLGAAVLLAAVGFFAGSDGADAAACDRGAVELRGDWGSARFRVEVADDADERNLGLMHRESLGRSAGMLFLYESPRRAAFWMRNTLIPLDMIFLDETGTVTRVHENAVPLDETPIEGGDDVLAVLEINGGLAGPMGIAPGTQLRHPDLDQEIAAWPCPRS